MSKTTNLSALSDVVTVKDSNIGVGTTTPTMPWDNHHGIHIQTEGGASDLRMTRTIDGVVDADYVIRADDPTNNFIIRDMIALKDPLRINGDGHVSLPYQPAFKTSGFDGTTNFNSGEGYAIGGTTAPINIGGHYNGSTKLFTAPVSGLYEFHMMFTHSSASSHYGQFFINGSRAEDWVLNYDSSTYTFLFYTAYYQLAAGDSVGAGMRNTAIGKHYSSSFQGRLIG